MRQLEIWLRRVISEALRDAASNNDRDVEIERENRSLFEQHKTRIESVIAANSAEYDKSLLTLSSAIIGASFAFLYVHSGTKPLHNCWVIVVAWLAFVLCVISTLTSYIVSNKGYERLLSQAKSYYLGNDDSADRAPRGYACAIDVLAVFAGAAFALGLVLMMTFAALNLPNK
jgi:hypothetical protein